MPLKPRKAISNVHPDPWYKLHFEIRNQFYDDTCINTQDALYFALLQDWIF
jgi:hypothetical protein